MSALEIINAKKKKVGEIAIHAPFLKEKVNKAVLHQAVKSHLAGLHHGTVDTKTRSEVLRTSKKLYKQKGTGGARHGSRKSSPFVGGGRVFGPHPRDYSHHLNKKVKKLAIREALKQRLIDGHITVINEIVFKEIKTKLALELLKNIGVEKGLIVLEERSEVIEKSIRNIRDIKVSQVDRLNVFDLLKYAKIIFTAKAFELIQNKFLVIEKE